MEDNGGSEERAILAVWKFIHLLLKGLFNVVCNLNLLSTSCLHKSMHTAASPGPCLCVGWCIYLAKALEVSQNFNKEGFSGLFFQTALVLMCNLKTD